MFNAKTIRLTEKLLVIAIIFLITTLLNSVMYAQNFGSIKKGVQINAPQKTYKAVLDPLPAGTYSIGTGGYFATIQAAFNKLSEDGIAGSVTLELVNNLYIAPTDSFGFLLKGPIPGANANSRVTIKPAPNKNVTIQGDGLVTLSFYNTNFITVDGVNTTGTTTLTIHSLHNSDYVFNDGIDFCNNSDHNVMQNITFICEDYNRQSGSGFLCWVGCIGAPDSNLIQNNNTKQAGIAHYFDCYNASLRPVGNIVRGNIIGSETDSLINKGICFFKCLNSVIENNSIQNLKITSGWSESDTFQVGIYSYYGINDIIRNNTVNNLKSNAGYTCSGIIIAGYANETGVQNQVYNNFVYDIQSTSTQYDGHIAGIQVFYNSYTRVYYNTVFLTGSGASKLGSAALYLWWNCQNAEIKDNIFVNSRDESIYCASSIKDLSTNSLSSNNNDLFYSQNQYNCLVRKGSTDYHTLAEWQTTGKDLNSISEMPNFISSNDLHINSGIPTNIESHGLPIAGIDIDFDGQMRNPTTPDIGADEFDGTVLPVELTSFSAAIGNNIVTLNWQTATELNNNGFEVQRKIEASEFATIGFVQGNGTTTNPNNYTFTDENISNGNYFYRLKQIDFNGRYEYSNVIEVEVRSLDSYAIEQNYPNPFNPTTTIGYVLKEKSIAKLILLNAIGEEIYVLVNEELDKGFHKFDLNASSLPSGVYFYQLIAGNFVQTRKMILLK